MLQDPLSLLVIAAVTITSLILVTGPGGFARGGDFNRKYANKLMRMRLAAQFIAVILILVFVLFSGGR